MKKETYRRLMGLFGEDPAKRAALVWSDKVLTKIGYLAYPVLLAILAMEKHPQLLRAILVPGISVVLVSVFRYRYCAPRPYEVFGIPPVIQKDTKGKSFPSRHVFSIFMIAMAFLYFFPPAGALLCLIGVLMAVVRVLGGVHFPRDVIVGTLVGIGCGLVGFYMLPA